MEKINTIQKISKKKFDDIVEVGDNAAVVCETKYPAGSNIVKIYARHNYPDDENPGGIPNFYVNRRIVRQNQFGPRSKDIICLDADEFPTENSINLITSGRLYHIFQDLQNQINELKEQIQND